MYTQQPPTSDTDGLAASQVDRGGYVGKGFGEDNQAFFDMCQQMGGPRLLPSKPRGGREEAGGRVDPAETANSPRSIANPAAVNDVSADDSEGKVGQVWKTQASYIYIRGAAGA